MTCQGGTLGYSDVWYLQRGQSLQGANGEIITPDSTLGLASVGFPSREAEPTASAVSSCVPAATPDDGPSHRARLRDHLRRAFCEADGRFAWGTDMLEPDEYGDHADAALTVLHREWPWLRAEAEDAADATPVAPSAGRSNETAPSVAGRSDLGTEFVHQADRPDGAALAAFETDVRGAASVDPASLRDRTAAPAAWIDGHPQLEAIAAAVYERCETGDGGIVHDDPRNIAVAVKATLCRLAAEAQQQQATSRVDATRSELVRILAAHTNSLAATLEDFTGTAATSLQPGLKRTLDFLRLYREQLLAGQLSAEMRRLLDHLAAEAQRDAPWATDGARIGRVLIWSHADIGNGDFGRGYQAAQEEARAILTQPLLGAEANPEPETVTPSARAGLRQQLATALVRYDWNAGLSGRDTPSEHHYGEVDAMLAVLYREWPWMRAEAEDAPAAGVRQPDTETQPAWTSGPVAPARAAEWVSQQRAATVDPAMCPRCKGDNQEAFELCPTCAAGGVGGVADETGEDVVPHTMLGAAEIETRPDLNVTPLTGDALNADEEVGQ